MLPCCVLPYPACGQSSIMGPYSDLGPVLPFLTLASSPLTFHFSFQVYIQLKQKRKSDLPSHSLNPTLCMCFFSQACHTLLCTSVSPFSYPFTLPNPHPVKVVHDPPHPTLLYSTLRARAFFIRANHCPSIFLFPSHFLFTPIDFPAHSPLTAAPQPCSTPLQSTQHQAASTPPPLFFIFSSPPCTVSL